MISLCLSNDATDSRRAVTGENGYEYTRVIDSSEKFLRKNVFDQIDMGVLYADTVGSTKISLTLPSDKLSIMTSSFSQEMSYVIEKFGRYVLKFVGDVMRVLIVKRPFCIHDSRKSQYGLFKI